MSDEDYDTIAEAYESGHFGGGGGGGGGKKKRKARPTHGGKGRMGGTVPLQGDKPCPKGCVKKCCVKA